MGGVGGCAKDHAANDLELCKLHKFSVTSSKISSKQLSLTFNSYRFYAWISSYILFNWHVA